MKTLSFLFVGQPLYILVVTALFLSGYLLLRSTALGADRRPRPLLAAAAAWALYAAWERLVQVRTPEANIRIDLPVIWALLVVISAWAIFRALRKG